MFASTSRTAPSVFHVSGHAVAVTQNFPAQRRNSRAKISCHPVAASESAHRGELRVVVEANLPLPGLWHGQSARGRAIELFSQLRVWDTEANSGVLIYLLLAEHAIEIVADRGFALDRAAPVLTPAPLARRSPACETSSTMPRRDRLTGAGVGPAALTFTVTMGGERDGLAVTVPIQHLSLIHI